MSENKPTEEKKRTVFLATPSQDGRVDARYSISLAHTYFALIINGFDPLIRMRINDAMLPRLRNDLVKEALEKKFDDIVLIDSDEDWNPAWVVELLKYPVDFVGAPVCKKADDIIDFNVKAINPQIDMSTGLVEVDSVGCGLLRLSRKAMQHLWDVSEPYQERGVWNRMMFNIVIDPSTKELVSEDNEACRKWKADGNSVYVAPHMDVVHIGPKAWQRPFREVLRARMEAVHGGKPPDTAWDPIRAGA